MPSVREMGEDVLGTAVTAVAVAVAFGIGGYILVTLNSSTGINIPNPFTGSITSAVTSIIMIAALVSAAGFIIWKLISSFRMSK